MTGTSEPDGLYELLGVRRDASAAEITRAYHRRARALHPDTQPGQATEPARFRELQEACRVLHDPARRAAYDQALRPAAARPAVTPTPRAAWPERPGRPATWPPGAALWAGPVHVTPPPGTTAASGAADARLAALADYLAWYPDGALGGGWPW